jgi:hypothetical protein
LSHFALYVFHCNEKYRWYIFGAKFDVLRQYINIDVDTVSLKSLFVFHRFVSVYCSLSFSLFKRLLFPPLSNSVSHTKNSVGLLLGVEAVNSLIRVSQCSIKNVFFSFALNYFKREATSVLLSEIMAKFPAS